MRARRSGILLQYMYNPDTRPRPVESVGHGAGLSGFKPIAHELTSYGGSSLTLASPLTQPPAPPKRCVEHTIFSGQPCKATKCRHACRQLARNLIALVWKKMHTPEIRQHRWQPHLNGNRMCQRPRQRPQPDADPAAGAPLSTGRSGSCAGPSARLSHEYSVSNWRTSPTVSSERLRTSK